MSGSVWEIELLGPLRARRGERYVSHFRTHKTGALLACLALNAGKPARREALIEQLWPEYDIESGRNCLRIALNALRREFEPGEPPGSFLEADRAQVRLNPIAFSTDKDRFERMLLSASRAEEEERRGELLQQAATLYRSDLLPGYDEPWVMGERQRLADAHLLALRRLVQLLARRNDYAGALEFARRVVQADPLREESHRALIQLYAAMGRPGAALRQYQELAQLLQEELKTQPSTTTRELISRFSGQAELEAESQTPKGRATVTVTAQGHFSTPPPRYGGGLTLSRPNSLPVQLTRFFGREECLAQVVEILNVPETRLVTLTGMGGSGKTRLALALAENLQDRFDGAVWFVPLAGLTDAGRIPDAIFDTLNLSRQINVSVLDQVIASLRCGPSLLVLDNFEHLADEGAGLVATLLSQVPTLICLVTSRQRLNLSGEHEYAVMPLSTPHAPGAPERLMEFASVQLFVDRARSVRPTFEITSENASAIGELCRHLEGVPLAIELAAAYVPVMTPARILSRLTPRLPLLVNRGRDAHPRHASLRATLQWSSRLLDPTVQRLFTHLSLFRGGWTLDAAEAIFDCRASASDLASLLGPDTFSSPNPGVRNMDVLEGLMQLRERSLITTEERGDEMRFSMLETVREFAAEQWVNEEEEERAIEAFVDYSIRLAEMAETQLSGRDAPFHLRRLELEHDNLLAALERSSAHPEQRLRLAGALWRFWYMRGYLEEGTTWLETVLQACKETTSVWLNRACKGAGNLAFARQDYPMAQHYFERYLKLSECSEDQPGRATALGSLGNVARERNDLDQSQRLLTESLHLFERLGDARGKMLSQANLAILAINREDYATARALIEETLTGFRAAGDVQNTQQALNNLAATLLHTEESETTASLLAESLTLTRELQSRSGAIQALRHCARLAAQRQALPQAALLFGASEALSERYRVSMPLGAVGIYERAQDRVAQSLGESQYLQAWQQGQHMSLDQTIGYALEWLQPDLYGFWSELTPNE